MLIIGSFRNTYSAVERQLNDKDNGEENFKTNPFTEKGGA